MQGKTRQLFFYKLIGYENMVLVDAPGYGFAQGNKKEVHSWKKMMEIYLKQSAYLHRVLCLMDGRSLPGQMELEVLHDLT